MQPASKAFKPLESRKRFGIIKPRERVKNCSKSKAIKEKVKRLVRRIPRYNNGFFALRQWLEKSAKNKIATRINPRKVGEVTPR